MPGMEWNVEAHKPGLSAKMQDLWRTVADSALEKCQAEGKDDCEASAIRQANAVVSGRLGEGLSLAEKLATALHEDQLSEATQGALRSISRKQVRSRLREMDLGGVSVSEFEMKLDGAIATAVGPSSGAHILDVYDGLVVFDAMDGMWGAPYKVSPEGAISVGKPIRVRRTCRYIPDEVIAEQPPIEDRGQQPTVPDDWWMRKRDWWSDGNKALGGGSPTDGGQSRGQEAQSEAVQPIEEAVLVESTFLEASVSGLGPVEFDKDGTIPICIIQPGQGSSAYYETPQLKRDGGVFKGALSFFDHQTTTEERERPEGSILNVAGKVTESGWSDTGFKGPGTYGRMFVIEPHREFVRHVAPLTGLSIRATGKTVEKEVNGKRVRVAERFTKAISVDLVTAAGAGGQVGTLQESTRQSVARMQESFFLDHGTEKDSPALAGEFIEWARTIETQEPEEDNVAEEAKVADLETKVTQLTDENKRLAEAILLREVGDLVSSELAKEKDLPEITKTRLAEVLKRETPLKEGKLDTEALKAKIGESVKAEKAYLAALVPAGIKGMGGTPADDDKAGKARLRESRIRMYRGQGKSKEEAEKLADAGSR